MSSMSVAQAKSQFSDLLRRAEYTGDRVVVHRRGRPVAAIVSTEDLRRLEALDDAQDVKDAKAALEEAERLGTIPLEAVLRKYGLEHLLRSSPEGKPRGRGGLASHQRAKRRDRSS